MAVQVILALVVGLVFAALFVVAQFAADRVKQDHHKTHDANNVLGLIRMANHMGDDAKIELGFNMLKAILNPDEESVVRLRRLIKSVTDMIETPMGCEVHLSLNAEIDVRVVPRDAMTLLQNLLQNAIEAASSIHRDRRLPVMVDLTDDRMIIRNIARAESLAALRGGAGATTKDGSNHGIGRQSIQRCCDLLGWTIEYDIEGPFVVTTIRGFVPASDCATVDSGEDRS